MYRENKDFYPTPPEVIKKMLAPYHQESWREHNHVRGHYKLAGLHILEPSAGSGNILDFLKEQGHVRSQHLYAIEQDPNLAHILQGKGYKVIGNDFMQYDGDYCFDLIIANPPFSSGDRHLLHMWEILQRGSIICLLNSETVRNPYSENRKLLTRLIHDHGSVEHIGPVFTDAERRTEVETCIVRLIKEGKSKVDFTFQNVTEEAKVEFSDKMVGDSVAVNDFTGSLLRCYEKTKEAFTDYIKARNALESFSGPILRSTDHILDMAAASCKDESTDTGRYNAFMDTFKYCAWKSILSKLQIEKYLTNSARKTFEEFAKSHGAMDLTRENIHALIMMIVQNKDKILNDAVIEVFDIFTKYHCANRIHPEGWKTNEAWVVGPKVILPHYIEMGFGSHYSVNHRRWDEFSDIDRVMCYLTGTDFDSLDKLPEGWAMENAKDSEQKHTNLSLKNAIRQVGIGDQSWHPSAFFWIRCYKKGTIHLKWKDEALRAKFNQVACQGKFNLGYSRKKSRTKKTA
ncbi:DUF4942 domain-containing protein [Cyclobacterium jeungdonense]|uniref:DUF4942 domain-containing protein n=1 Tax=Cyclobacterium jeungdonense TaxID=708087 RepID=A0ABT8C9Q9_9BACT|nr:DUF4942 domain-containing protein [Cyclobacterium jeungdonense]MDN3689072.1 DUF4942 domain-containing protein [Cyclobacterium jeungdonense]